MENNSYTGNMKSLEIRMFWSGGGGGWLVGLGATILSLGYDGIKTSLWLRSVLCNFVVMGLISMVIKDLAAKFIELGDGNNTEACKTYTHIYTRVCIIIR